VRKHSKRMLAGVFLSVLVVLGFSSAAMAAGNYTPSSPLTPNAQGKATVTVNWTGMAQNQPVIIEQCNNVNAGFELLNDCTFLSLILVNGTANGEGNTTFTVSKVQDGWEDLSRPWVCDPSGTPDGSGPLDAEGRQVFSTCRIRVTDESRETTTRQFFLPFQFGQGEPEPEPVVPEAPFAVLLPLGAVAVAGGAFFVLRNRKPALGA
jgi:hypothetical protein